MKLTDKIASINQRHWDWAVKKGAGCTIPWLDLNPEVLKLYAKDRLKSVPEQFEEIYPSYVLKDVDGKDVLCLATGGGQQSAVFSLLGAKVTVLDLSKGQLDGDRRAAAHYGYQVNTIQADMRDISFFTSKSFDLVYQGNSMAWIPDVKPVYTGVNRVLRSGGLYRVDFSNPATEFVDWHSWDGEGYRITFPYDEKVEHPGTKGEQDYMQFRHYMSEIFNGLLEVDMSIQYVQDSPHYFKCKKQEIPGEWDHWLRYVGGFAVVAQKK